MFHVRRYDPDQQDDTVQKKPELSTGDRDNSRIATTKRKSAMAGASKHQIQKQREQQQASSPAVTAATVIGKTHHDRRSKKQRGLRMTALLSSKEAVDDMDLLDEELIETIEEEEEDEDSTEKDSLKQAALAAGSVAAAAAASSLPPPKTETGDDALLAATALHASQLVPISTAAQHWKLAPLLTENLLRRDGGTFQHFFPIQSVAIPDILASDRQSHFRAARDVCITAPTGSGKTLAYVLPILHSLMKASQPCTAAAAATCGSSRGSRNARRLRALVVLPSRDLASQVHLVFVRYAEGSDLRVGLAIGQSDFAAEQKMLTVDVDSMDPAVLRNRLRYDPGDLDLALQLFRHSTGCDTAKTASHRGIPRNGWSNADILVCTPGRLVDHLDNTPGFTLQHLRFLAIDEADRLLSQSYHNWIDRVLEAASAVSVSAHRDMMNASYVPSLQLTPDRCSVRLEPITWRRGGTQRDDTETYDSNAISNASSSSDASVCQPVQLRKILVSATLTHDPQKLAALKLVNPKHFNVHQLVGSNSKYAMPDALEERVVECTAEQKPLVLLSLLLEKLQQTQQHKSIIVVFTASLDSTHRLARLLQLLWIALDYGNDAVGEFSSALNQNERALLMNRCKDANDNLSVVVCSDGMSRGMDLDFVDVVVNYDVPSLAKTYVHRCGRTARASRVGTAISLLKGGQVSQFYRMRQLIQAANRVKPFSLQKNLVRDAIQEYKFCIKALKAVLDAEEAGELGHSDAVEDYVRDIDR
jgi:ATP-dependent RNA helicase DDX51/DBP6